MFQGRFKGQDPASVIVFFASMIIIVIFGGFDLFTHVGMKLGGGYGTWNPFNLPSDLRSGAASMPRLAWIISTLLLSLTSALVSALVWWIRKTRRHITRRRGDEAAKLMGGRGASSAVRKRSVQKKAEKFLAGSDIDAAEHPGFFLGIDVATKEPLYGDYEAVAMYMAGPRSGKTAAVAIPIICDAPGAVIATSNKRDLVDLTRGVREKVGKAYVFDPSGILKREPEIFWDPLSYLQARTGYNGSVMERAERLSAIIGDSGRAAGAGDQGGRYDSFFDGHGDALRAELLMAASLKPGGTLVDVFRWIVDEEEEEPAELLTGQGYEVAADDVRSKMNLPPDTKGGVLACALMGLSFVKDEALRAWYTPGDGRDCFNPAQFAASSDTLYSMSRDSSSAAPLVAALTSVCCYAGEYTAEANGGRLPVPMMIMLDEAANVCPWRELPKIYSHFGSKGLCLHTVLQSWSQGQNVWGELGMNMLWAAANIRMYLGGSPDTRFLGDLSTLIGKHKKAQYSSSTSKGQKTHSVTQDAQEVPIAPVEDLAALPEWRAWLFPSKSRPVMVELVPWFTEEYAPEVIASEKAYGAVALPQPTAADTAFTEATEEPVFREVVS